MDKYTVDIDKVLNDFEYSELTDQYNSSTSHVNNNVHTTQRQPDSYSKFNNTPSKHTITNVFQSLDEYLNTDVGGKSNLNSNNSASTSHNLINTQPELSIGNSNPFIPTTTALPEDILSEFVKENSSNGATTSILCMQSSTEESQLQTQLISVSEPQTSLGCDLEPETSHLEEQAVVVNNLQPGGVTDVELLESKENDLPPQDNKINIEDEKILTLEVPEEVNHVDNTEDPIINNNEVANSVAEKEDPMEEPPVDLEIQEEPPINENSVVVGFNDDSLGINDSELHQYLDELETEYDNQLTETPQSINTSVVEPEIVEVAVSSDVQNKDCSKEEQEVVVVVAGEEEEEEDKNVISRPNSLKINNESQIDLVGEPGSTPYNNVYVAKTLKTTQESDTESSSSTSPAFSDVSSESNISTASTESVTDSMDKTAPKNVEIAQESSSKCLDGNDVPSTATFIDAENTESAPNDNYVMDEDEATNEEASRIRRMQQEAAHAQQSANADSWLGKQAPLWIPDSEAPNCLHCDTKFTVIKRRHHCRACGLVLCSKCCNMKYRLEYLEMEARVCLKCYEILNRDSNSSSGSEISPSLGNSPNRQPQQNQPNPNNPMEYCSMVPPLQQMNESSQQNPPSVMVPVGVLKRKGASKTRTNKSVMFCDGIRPGSELTNLDTDFNYNESRSSHSKKGSPPPPKINKNTPAFDTVTRSFIPNTENHLPPTVMVYKADISYSECTNNQSLIDTLKNESLTFAIQRNLYVHVKIINMDCCINKWAWCFTTEGMIAVSQDEIVILLEFIDNEKSVPKDMFLHLNNIYNDAQKGNSITEYGISLHSTTNFLESKSHIGFLYIRPTFQCLQNVIIPKEPYLIGILIHRWEMPWAKIFPLRLVLRLGAEYRYYPSPIISTRHRESVFVEIGHTIINLLADFRNFSYTLPNIRGLTIHMEEKNTTITIPSNRYDQVIKSLNNSSDHILAFGGNFSTQADSHLVCIQDTHGNNENTYTTHAINIHSRPRKVTGASFIVFNGALKSSSGLTAKSSIVEDGLMIQIPPEHMVQIRESLRNMKNHTIQCGCINATTDETVNIIWGENDVNFNMGVQSPIDNQPLNGVPSIRAHNGKDYICNSGSRMIRWTEVFILQNGDDNVGEQDLDFSKLAENISKATCQALVKYLDLLSTNNFYKIGVRTTLHIENVSYSAGSNGMKLPPIYMKSLDNELIPVLHRITSNNLGENAIVLELIFRILNL